MMRKNVNPLLLHMSTRLLFLLLLSVVSLKGSAYNMSRISSSDGMTNSAVLSLCQDSDGLLWIGTCDGVNLYDGITVYPLTEIYPSHPLSGNIVEGIAESTDGIMWIRTNYGINRLDRYTGETEVFPQFQGREMMRMNSKDEVFVLGEDGCIYQYDNDRNKFEILPGLTIDRDTVYEISFVADKLLIFSHGGIHSRLLQPGGKDRTVTVDPTPLQFSRKNGKSVVTVDSKGIARRFDPATFANDSLTDLGPLIKTKGVISDIATDRKDNLFISFETAGVVKANHNEGYRPRDLGLRAGIFCLLPSRKQDVVWIGSDCQGVYTYYTGKYDIRSLNFSHFNNLISHPVRSMLIDDRRTLWLGTKGDGLLMVKDFDIRNGSYSSMKLFTSANSPLKHNMVFTTVGSSRPRLWIGGEEGINVYDYSTERILDVDFGKRIRWVHGIYEQNDSILWIATIGQGVWRAVIDDGFPVPRLKSLKQYTLNSGNFSSNYFFSLSVDSDGKPVFSNRGMGAVLFDEGVDRLRVVSLDGEYDTRTVNDVFATYKEGNEYWLGTGHGLLHKSPEGETLYYGPEKGFTNSTIHSVLKSHDGDIWVSTNKGLVCLDPESGRGDLFDVDAGVTVSEFSDGAACYSHNHSLLFGGIDGITVVSPDTAFVNYTEYRPSTRLIGMSIGRKSVNLSSYYSYRTNDLAISYDQPYFSLIFSSPDFVNSYNSKFYYSLDGKEWVTNGKDNIWSFTNMAPGNYQLYVKYVNMQTGFEGDSIVVTLRITPPWYLSGIAKAIYAFIALTLIGGIVYYLLQRQKRRQQLSLNVIKAAHKEEVYEEKLKFFTNITHEFCTPLTLIYGPCERILSYEGADNYVRKYVSLIRNNTRRLNNLIQEIIDFRRIETGNNRRKVRHIDVSDLCKDIIESFSDLAERNDIKVINSIDPDIAWNTDYRSISKIITNLVSNAFKYTAPGGTVRIGLEKKNDSLVITVYNTGKGIKEEDKERIFNRYAILDNVEEKATEGLTARNGLGMAICHSMVEILEGKIEIDSVVGSYACFIVTLPQLEIDSEEPVSGHEKQPAPVLPAEKPKPSKKKKEEKKEEKKKEEEEEEYYNDEDGEEDFFDIRAPKRDRNIPRILIVDDNEEMLTLLADSLSEYEIIKATDGGKALQMIIDTMPDLIITDIMMPGTDGLELTRQIKQNRHTMHVPLIILSAKSSNEEIVAGIENGADVYISKPFSFSYLRAMIERLLDYNCKLREYYSTSASAYEYTGGHLMGKEDKEFMDKIKAFIDDNMENPDLTPETIAQYLNTSIRNLYRRFTELGQMPPNDYIKAYRVSFGARLLRTTSLTIQEIMYRCGFGTRSTFYKEFDKRYHMTPREYRSSKRTKDNSLSEEK